MSLISVSDVRQALGEAYSSIPDETISSFISQRESELKDIIGSTDLSQASFQSLLKNWIISKVCVDCIQYSSGSDFAVALDYSLGDLRESRANNVRLKKEWIEHLEQRADRALREYLRKTVSYQAVEL